MTKITLNHITKVEGHANLELSIEQNKVKKCELHVIEGARFFEGLLVERDVLEAHEITSRICGICSSSHTICSLMAIEAALKIKVSKQTQILRELMMLGERIRSHATHLYFFVLPDYTGYESAIAMASSNKDKIQNAMTLIKIGNNIVSTIGGREMHPFTCVPGGFTSIPNVTNLKKELKIALKSAQRAFTLFSTQEYPNFQRDTDQLSLKGKGYPLIGGNIYSKNKLNTMDYEKHINEKIESYSTAKFALRKGQKYQVGALSRINNPSLSSPLKKLSLKLNTNNPFHNNIAQAIELIHSIEYAMKLLKYKFKEENIPEITLKPGRGIAAVEAPRGILIHDYKVNSEGKIIRANIITPTCQNLKSIESDIQNHVQLLLEQSTGREKLVLEIEKLIRAYDPCFSCSTHFLKIKWT